ncbi:MAG TPA: DUF4198 domain-containing protein [Methylomirabilota bacterium]|nr:DUF4198 domain-containing protein [Methylomirabilota bacterium]
MRRTRTPLRPAVLGLVLLAASAGVSVAHQFWLDVTDHAPRRGEVVEVRALSGTGFRGETRPWTGARCVEFAWHTDRRLALAPFATEGETRWAAQAFVDTTGGWVQYQSTFASIELPAGEFDAYLTEEGLSGPLAARARLEPKPLGRERYRRCCKAWLAGRDERRATKPLGQPLELVPRSRPGAASELRVRVLWQGHPLAGALVKTWRQPLAANGHTRPVLERDSVEVAQEARSDVNGDVRLDVRAAGEWLVSTVHMVAASETKRAPGTPDADWESTWASLTFARLVPDAKPPSAP